MSLLLLKGRTGLLQSIIENYSNPASDITIQVTQTHRQGMTCGVDAITFRLIRATCPKKDFVRLYSIIYNFLILQEKEKNPDTHTEYLGHISVNYRQ